MVTKIENVRISFPDISRWNEPDADPLADIQRYLSEAMSSLLTSGEVVITVPDDYAPHALSYMTDNPGVKAIVFEPSGVKMNRTEHGIEAEGWYELTSDGTLRVKGRRQGLSQRFYVSYETQPEQPEVELRKPDIMDYQDVLAAGGLIERHNARKKLARTTPKGEYQKHNTRFGGRRGKGRA